MTQIVAIQTEDRILLVQQSAVQGPPGPPGASGSGVAVSGGTGTVTSVGLIVPSGLAVSGSPITSSGTFTVTYASGIRAYTTAEATKLAGVASGATANSGTVTSIALTMPSGLVVSGSPIVSSGLLAVTYASGVQAYTSAEAVKLAGIASGATVSSGTVTSVSLVPPSGLVASGSPIVGSGTIAFVYASGIQAYTTAESNKLATIASGAQVNVGTNLSYSGASRALNSSTGSGVILPLFTNSEAGLVGGSGGGTINFLRADGQWAAPPAGSGTSSGTSGGTVTSVGLVVPSGFSVSGPPVTTSGDIALIFASGFSLPTLASQDSWNTAFNERLYWDGGSTGLNSASGRTNLGLTALATATPSGGLSIEGGNLVPGEIVKLIVSDVGQTGITTGNFKSETRLDRPFAVVGVWWNCHPTTMGSGGTSDARPYIRTGAGTTSAGTKINLLTTSGNIASLAASVHTVNATSSISGGTYSGATGDWLGVDLQSLGAGSSGHQLTYILRYS